MTILSKHVSSNLCFYLWAIVIITISIGIRVYRVGLYHLNQDEMNLLFWGLQVGRNGEWIWLSNNWIGWAGGDWMPITHHSPLNNYLIALPYLFTPDPTIIRGFIGTLSGIGVVFIYLMMSRYFNPTTAVISGVLLAGLNGAVYWSRFVFHPMGQIFIALHIATGLPAYYENKPKFMIIHLVSLALAIQFHPANILLMPISGGLIIASYFKNRGLRKQLIMGTVVGTLLSALTFGPWLYGTLNRNLETNIAATSVASIDSHQEPISLGRIWGIYQTNVGARITWFERSNNYTDVLFPPRWMERVVTDWQPRLILLSSLILLVYCARRWWENLPILYLISIGILPLIFARIVSATFFDDWYFVMVIYGAIPTLAIAFGKIANWNKFSFITIGIITVFLFTIHMWLNVAGIVWTTQENGWTSPLRAPMSSLRGIIDDMSSELVDDQSEVIIIIDELYGRFSLPVFHEYIWSIVSEGYPTRIIPRYHLQGIPIPAEGQSILFSGSVGSTIPLFSDAIESFGETIQGQGPIFQKALFDPSQLGSYQFVPNEIAHFENNAHILGAYISDDPQPGQTWSVLLVWESKTDNQDKNYQFSLRLVDENDNRFAQQDLRSLDSTLWRTGDLIFNPFTLQIPETYDPNTTPRLQILMYEFETGTNANAILETGQAMGQWLYLSPVE